MSDENAPGGLGRLPSQPDRRDRNFLLAARVAPATRRLNFRSWFTPVPMDQGMTSQCVAYSGVHLLQSGPIVNAGVDPSDLYRDCQLRDEWPGENYDGTSLRGLGKALLARGLIDSYHWGWDIDDAIDHVLAVGPVVFGVDWFEGMDKPDEQGYAHAVGSIRGGHALIANVVSMERKAFRLTNSWGTRWGQGGRAWVSFKDVEKLLQDTGELLAVQERRVR